MADELNAQPKEPNITVSALLSWDSSNNIFDVSGLVYTVPAPDQLPQFIADLKTKKGGANGSGDASEVNISNGGNKQNRKSKTKGRRSYRAKTRRSKSKSKMQKNDM